MIYDFNRALALLDAPIIMDFFLPFFLLFAVLFASLEKIKIFKEKKVNILVSLIILLLTVIPHTTGRYPPGKDVVAIMMNSIPAVAAVIIAIIMLFILLGLFFGEQKFAGASVSGWISVLCIAAVVYIFGSSAGWWSGWNSITRIIGRDAISLVIIIIVFGLIINFITKGGEEPATPGDKIMDKIGGFFGNK